MRHRDRLYPKIRANVARQKAEMRAFLLTAKATGCIDCPENDPACLDFDHRDRVHKVATISAMVARGFSLKKIKVEIEKCDIRCSNCHRKRTVKLKHWQKAK